MKKTKRNYKVIVNWFDSLKGIGEGELTTGQHETVFLNAGNILSSGFKNLSSGEVISCELARNDDGNLYAVTIHKGKSSMKKKKYSPYDIKSLRRCIDMAAEATLSQELDANFIVEEDFGEGLEGWHCYTVAMAPREFTLYCDKGTASFVVDIYGSRVSCSLVDWEKDEAVAIKSNPKKKKSSLFKSSLALVDEEEEKDAAQANESYVRHMKAQVTRSSEIKKLMQSLAYATETDFDGDPEDLRLHDQMINTRSLNFTKAQYKKMEDDINNFEIEGDGFGVYAVCDVSGYQYWTKNMKEDNYINIYVAIDEDALLKDRLSPLAIMQAIDEARNHFSKYERIHY